MRDDPPLEDEGGSAGPGPGSEPPGSLRPTKVGALAGWGAVGLVVGYAVHPLSQRYGAVPPSVSWAQPLTIWLLAAILGYTAWATWRTVHVRRELLQAHKAVNRFVLARACALVAALVAGGYLGYGLSWVGEPSERVDDRLLRSLVAAAAGIAAAVAALLLERACRVRSDDDQA